MFKQRTKLYINNDERIIIINALIEFRNEYLSKGKDTFNIDNVILKLSK